MTITMQCADVKKVLGSVSRMNEAGNTIIFSKGRSAVIRDPSSRIAQEAINKVDKSTHIHGSFPVV